MSFFKTIFKKILNLPLIFKIILPIVLVGLTWFIVSKTTAKNKSSVQYQTTQAEKGVLIKSISATGTITSTNKTSITTGATGTIKAVYVKNGDTVKKGQKIAEITLDDDGSKNQTIAWANYLTAVENQKKAVADQSGADIQMWKDRQAVLDAQTEYDNMTAGAWNPKTHAEYTYNEKAIVEKTLQQAKLTFTTDEAKFNDTSGFISKSNVQVSDALNSYQKVSSVIYAPASGVIDNLNIAAGVVISNTSSSITVSSGTDSNTNSSSVTSHSVGSVTNPKGQYQATLNLTESDIVKIKSDQKVSMTLDAYSNKTFTGKVLAVTVSGSTNSGVTTYPVTVLIDPSDDPIYQNMTVTASIILSTKSDVILIPSTAIDTNNGTSTVRVMKDNQISTVTVQVGDNNDTETEITSGLNEGDSVITSSISNSAKSNNNNSSVFGSTNRSTNNNRSGNSGGVNPGFGGPGGF